MSPNVLSIVMEERLGGIDWDGRGGVGVVLETVSPVQIMVSVFCP